MLGRCRSVCASAAVSPPRTRTGRLPQSHETQGNCRISGSRPSCTIARFGFMLPCAARMLAAMLRDREWRINAESRTEPPYGRVAKATRTAAPRRGASDMPSAANGRKTSVRSTISIVTTRARRALASPQTGTSRRGFLDGAGSPPSARRWAARVVRRHIPRALPGRFAQGAPPPAAAPAPPRVPLRNSRPQLLNFPARTATRRLGERPLVAGRRKASERRHTPTSSHIRTTARSRDHARSGAWKSPRLRGEQELDLRPATEKRFRPRDHAMVWNAAATGARSSRRRRAAISGPTAASAARNGPGCDWPTS